jgi:hypothetical protein
MSQTVYHGVQDGGQIPASPADARHKAIQQVCRIGATNGWTRERISDYVFERYGHELAKITRDEYLEIMKVISKGFQDAQVL